MTELAVEVARELGEGPLFGYEVAGRDFPFPIPVQSREEIFLAAPIRRDRLVEIGLDRATAD